MDYIHKEARIIIAMPDGRIFEGGAFSIQLEEKRDTGNFRADDLPLRRYMQYVSFELTAVLAPEFSITYTEDEFKETLEKRRAEMLLTRRYQCSWCGTINSIDNLTCDSCGGARPIFWELLEV